MRLILCPRHRSHAIAPAAAPPPTIHRTLCTAATPSKGAAVAVGVNVPFHEPAPVALTIPPETADPDGTKPVCNGGSAAMVGSTSARGGEEGSIEAEVEVLVALKVLLLLPFKLAQ